MKNTFSPALLSLYDKIKDILESARKWSYRAVNFEMAKAYREIGRTIVEEEQDGGERADYVSRLLLGLSDRLTKDYGKGFDESNLCNMRLFYLRYKKRDALRSELSWTHYRILMRVEEEPAREFYLQECVEGGWSTRQLERQIHNLYFNCILIRKFVKRNLSPKPIEARDLFLCS